MRPLNLTATDLTDTQVWMEGLSTDLKNLNNTAEQPLVNRGVSKNELYKNKAGLYDGNAPSCLGSLLNGRAYKVERSCLLMGYTLRGLLTRLVVGRAGVMEVHKLSSRGGVFLEHNLGDEAVVFSDPVDALIGSHDRIAAVCVTDPGVLVQFNTNVVLIDSPTKPLEPSTALIYNKLYPNLQIVTLSGSAAALRRGRLIGEFKTNRQSFLSWMSSTIARGFLSNSQYLSISLEDAGMADTMKTTIIDQLKSDEVDPFTIEWFKALDLTARSITVQGSRIIQTKAGWRISGYDRFVANFQLRVDRARTIRRTRIAECSLTFDNGKEYTMQVTAKQLATHRSINGLIFSSIKEGGKLPHILCDNLPKEGPDWLTIASGFQPCVHMVQDVSSIGFKDFSDLYNEIFSNTQYTDPTTLSKFNKGGPDSIGYWHHETGDLWLSKHRLAAALDTMVDDPITGSTLEACFDDRVGRAQRSGAKFYVFPTCMIDRSKKVIEFKVQ